MKLKIFIKKDCPRCPLAKQLGQEVKDKISVDFLSVDESDGLAGAQFYSILATPSLVLCDEKENEIFSWRGETPQKEDLLNKMGISA